VSQFLEMLRSRRDAARQKLDAARKAVTAAEAELRKWSDAVELEQSGNSPPSKVEPSGEVFRLTLENIKSKEDILRQALHSAGKPVKVAELVKMVSPAVSRAYVYLVIGQMKDAGELKVFPGGKFMLKEEEGKAKGEPKSAL
jgi:hypothetical protein